MQTLASKRLGGIWGQNGDGWRPNFADPTPHRSNPHSLISTTLQHQIWMFSDFYYYYYYYYYYHYCCYNCYYCCCYGCCCHCCRCCSCYCYCCRYCSCYCYCRCCYGYCYSNSDKELRQSMACLRCSLSLGDWIDLPSLTKRDTIGTHVGWPCYDGL